VPFFIIACTKVCSSFCPSSACYLKTLSLSSVCLRC
jgi:hypothetical protein